MKMKEEEIIFGSNLKVAINKLDTLKDKLALSDVLKEKAIHMYKKIIEKNIIRGRSIDAMVAATIYVACRDSETSHTLNDITKATGLRKNSIAKCYRAILTNLNLQIPVSDISQCFLRIVNDMGISEMSKQILTEKEKEAMRIYSKKYYQKHREYHKQYAKDNKEKYYQIAKKWRLVNPKKVKASAQKHRDKDPEALKRYNKEYRRLWRAKRKAEGKKYS